MEKSTSKTLNVIFGILVLGFSIYSFATGANGPGILFLVIAIYIIYRIATT